MTNKPTSDMAPIDWEDISNSEFVDVARGQITRKIAFVFDHPEKGLLGFEYHPDEYHIKPVRYERNND